ncbi:MAG: TPM domain-containing protein [Gallionellaceae bacterium]|nr:TPM domain-containing protein [Gallionellaceae bacterium]
MSRTLGRSALFLCLLLACLRAFAADVPYLSGRITDNAEVLGAGTKQRLNALLKAHEMETGNQVAVLTVNSLEGENVEEYAHAVFNAWKLGQKGQDNGVLVLVAPGERRMRIEVGYGLEGTLTDVVASRIIRNVMTPRFKSGDFDAGIEVGVQAVIGQLAGTETLPADPPSGGEGKSDSFFERPDLPLPERILFGAFIFGIIGLFTVIGILTPGMGWFLYFFLIPFWAMFPIVVVGVKGALTLLGIYLVGFPVAKLLVARAPWYEKAKRDIKTKGSARIGGFTLGGSSGSSSSWSSSSSGGGGFSGGGGSSGGGGASGSW